GIGPRAGIAVVAVRAVGLRGLGAPAGGGIARAGHVTLIGGRARDRIAAGADAAVAGVDLRAGIAVVAGCAVGSGRTGARTGARIARARIVALIRCGAGDRIPTGADAGLARVGPRAGAPVVAGRAVRLLRVRAGAGGRIAGSHVVTLVEHGADDRI